MAYNHYDRLSALDATFLDLEDDSVHMHVGSVGLFDPGPLATEGGVDFDQLLVLAENALTRTPRFRQMLDYIPVSGHPVWVDDPHFNLRYHIRHTALPHPGDVRQLKRLTGRIMSQKLDRSKPLWEIWFVEGLEDGRLAVISKVHHAMIDGISGVDLLSAFMGFDADFRVGEDGIEWMPRPRPSGVGLLRDEVLRRASLPVRATRAAMKILGSGERAEAIGHGAFGFLSSLADSIRPASETPFNVPIGPHRRFDWTRFSIDHVSEVRERIGGTLNDVVLACVAGATRHYFERHQMVVDDIDFRAFVPVSTRKPQQRGRLGNHVSLVMVPLPLAEPEPRKRLEQVSVETQRVKGSGVAEGTELFEEVTDWTAPGLLTQMSRISATRRFFNMVVTNVPGPQQPVFMNGATMHEIYPLVPLFTNQALGVALFSYDGSLFWGFNADWDAIPDLHAYVELIDEEFETLRKS